MIHTDHTENYPFYPATIECFFCSNPILDKPFVNWMGHGENIFLHPTCTMEFCLRLLRDVHEIECRYHQEVRLETIPQGPDLLAME